MRPVTPQMLAAYLGGRTTQAHLNRAIDAGEFAFAFGKHRTLTISVYELVHQNPEFKLANHPIGVSGSTVHIVRRFILDEKVQDLDVTRYWIRMSDPDAPNRAYDLVSWDVEGLSERTIEALLVFCGRIYRINTRAARKRRPMPDIGSFAVDKSFIASPQHRVAKGLSR